MPANLNDYVNGLLAHTANATDTDKVEVSRIPSDINSAQDAQSIENMLIKENLSDFESRLLVKRMGSLAVSAC
jgi:hypothetical protein